MNKHSTVKAFGEFVIDKGVSKPSLSGGRKYPFSSMEVGDSFVVDATSASNARSAASRWGKRNATKFYSAKTKDGDLRIWRIE